MEAASIGQVRELLARYNLHPNKGLGQHFLVDKNILHKIVDAADIGDSDLVLEIGTGLGALTLPLAQRAGRVVTVEVDKRLEPVLKEVFQDHNNIFLITGDALKLDWSVILNQWSGGCVVCANLPYYITSPIIFKILEYQGLIRHAVLMMQKEVAQRLTAEAGSKDYGLLTVMTRWKSEVFLVTQVSPNCFFPKPEVASSVIRMVPRSNPAVEVKDEERFKELVRASFQRRRKTMANIIAACGWAPKEKAQEVLSCCRIDPKRRGETLTIEEFGMVANAFS